MRIFSSFFAFALVILFVTVSCQREPTAGVKATWIIQNQCDTEAKCASTMAGLKLRGVNRVYFNVWNKGKVYFNSPAMRNFAGDGAIGPDQLAWAVKHAKQNGMKIFAWFEYGLMAAYQSVNNDFARKAQSLGWTYTNTFDDYVWLKPTTDVTNLFANIVTDSIKGYPGINGIQLDDHFASPVTLAGKNPAPMTTAMQNVYNKIRAVSTTTIISLSPNIIPNSLNTYNVDWVRWANLGIISESAPQLYRPTYNEFKPLFDSTVSGTPASFRQYLFIGLRCNGESPLTTWTELEKMMNEVRSKNYGAAIWYGQCINEVYPTQIKQKWNP